MILVMFVALITCFEVEAATTREILKNFSDKKKSSIKLSQSSPFINELQIRPQFGRDSKSAELRFKITPKYSQRKELEKKIFKSKTEMGNHDREMTLSRQKALIHELMYSYVADNKKLMYLEKLLRNIKAAASRQAANFDLVAVKSEFDALKEEIQTRAEGAKSFLLTTVAQKEADKQELLIDTDLNFNLVEREFKKIKAVPFEETLSYSKISSESSEIRANKKLERLDSKPHFDFIGIEGELEGKQEWGITLNYSIPFGEGPKEDFKEYKMEYEKLYGKSEYNKFKTNIESLLNKAKSLEKTFSTLEKLYSKTYSSSEMLAVKLKQQEKLLSVYIKMIETREEAFAAFLELLASLPSEVDMMRFWSDNDKS